MRAPTLDGADLALHRFRLQNPRARLLLTHGMFANGRICTRLARFLCKEGFEPWVLDWRGHGASSRGPIDPDYERLAIHDVEAATRKVREATGDEALFWVGHSAGGVLPLIYLAQHPAETRRFRGIVAIGSQVSHGAKTFWNRLMMGGGWLVTSLNGRMSLRQVGMGPEDEERGVLNQWFRWNLRGSWVGSDGTNYLEHLRQIGTPFQGFAGGGDHRIAPFEGCRIVFEALGSADKTLFHCSKANGFLEDYGHQRLFTSPSAQREIWPRIADWLAQRS